jgi:2TM domain
MDSDERYRRAKRRVTVIKSFYIHLGIYVGIITLLFLIDLLTPGGWWFYWALLGWGIGVVAHALSVFGIAGLLGSEWEEKKIRELMDKKDRY